MYRRGIEKEEKSVGVRRPCLNGGERDDKVDGSDKRIDKLISRWIFNKPK